MRIVQISGRGRFEEILASFVSKVTVIELQVLSEGIKVPCSWDRVVCSRALQSAHITSSAAPAISTVQLWS